MSRRANVERLLNPRSIVFVGGGALSVAIEAARSIGFRGDVWVVNPNRPEIAGVRAHASLADLPGTPDAAFLAVRAELSIPALRELRALGCAGAVCYAAGFGEVGRAALEDELRAAAGDMAVLGPNCYGLLNYVDGAALWADFHGGRRVERGAAFVSQSGNLSLILTMPERGLPLSHLISTGNQAVLEAGDLLDVLVDDPRVSAIGLYLEGLRDVRGFWRAAARALERGIPLVVFKAGASELGGQMTLHHTGSAAGRDAGYRAMFDRLGIIRTGSIPELLETLKLLTISGPLPGRSLGALTCSGADSAMLADRAAEVGIALPPLAPEQVDDLRSYAGDFANFANPLDFNTQVWGKSELEVRCFESAMRSDRIDAVALVHDYPSPECSDRSGWNGICESFLAAHRSTGKPAVVISNFGETFPAEMRRRLCENGVTPLDGLREGLAALAHAGAWGERRAGILEAGDLEAAMDRVASGISSG